MDINEEDYLIDLDPFDKAYAMRHCYFTIRKLVKRFLSTIWYYL